MDSARFDTLAKTLAQAGTRRGLVRLVAALPLGATLAALGGDTPGATANDDHGSSHRRQRRKARHRHDPGQDKDTRKGKRTGKRSCANAGQIPKKGNRKGCCAGLSTDASGRCAAAAPAPAACTGLRPTNTSPTQGLQEAIDQAQTGDILTLCAGTWNLTSPVVINKDLTLVGAGAGATALDGNNTIVVLYTGESFAMKPIVTLQALTITKGKGIRGGGIVNNGTLTLIGVSVTGNTAHYGGGIYNNQGKVTLEDGSVVGGVAEERNTATFQGGGIYDNESTVILKAGSRVTGNSANDGGGIYTDGGRVMIDSGAIICSNIQLINDQCSGGFGGAGTCPNPADGTCPP